LELLAREFEIEAVVTKPKPAHHRGSFPVLDVAESLNLPIYTVSNKKELSDLIATKPFTSEIGVLIDFGIIVAQDTIDYFKKGIVNSHFSLLPEWRGADPITFAILSGQKQTGVSLMLLVEAMDEGPLLGFGVYDMLSDITTPQLTEDLVQLSAALLRDMLPSYANENPMPQTETVIRPHSQEETCKMMDKPFQPTYSRKLTKEDGRIDWTKPAITLEREIRAYAEWPKSYTKLADIDVIITSAEVTEDSGKPGEILDTNARLVIACGEGSLAIKTLKPAGKQEMPVQAFLAGYGSKL
jgi:methionyl-tRNA formyltransferase